MCVKAVHRMLMKLTTGNPQLSIISEIVRNVSIFTVLQNDVKIKRPV